MLRHLIHKNVRLTREHHFAGAFYPALPTALWELIKRTARIKNGLGDVTSGGRIVLANLASNALEVFSSRGCPADKHLRAENLLDTRPDFGLLHEITTDGSILAYSHSRNKARLRGETTAENLTCNFISALALMSRNLRKEYFLLCREVDLHTLRVGIVVGSVNLFRSDGRQ